MHKIKLYFPKSHYDKNFRAQLFPLLKPFVKGEGFSDMDRKKLYGLSQDDFYFTKHAGDADLMILPMSWNYYKIKGKEAIALAFIEKAKSLNKKVIIINTGDFGVKIPRLEQVIVFQFGGNRSKLSENFKGIPPFIEDPLKKYFERDSIIERKYQAMPTVGFCGQADGTLKTRIKELGFTLGRNVLSRIGRRNEVPQSLLSTSYLRASLLTKIKKSSLLIDNVIERKQYRAGATNKESRLATTLEFYNNMRDSDYVLCVRGAGNFSVRLYETLAMGRIPVFINTDCLLPLAKDIDWIKHMVWIELNEIDQLASKIIAFHQKLNADGFNNLQQSNRELWKEKLTLGGFYKCFLESV